MNHFHAFAKKIHVPFSKISSIRADFRIHIISLTADDSLFGAAEFFGLAGLGSASVIRTLIKVNAHEVFYSKKLVKLLALDEASLRTYCAKKKPSLADKRRLLKWSRWSKSAERIAMVGFFKGRWEKRISKTAS
jgi:hypothetical protein